ncbi:cytidine deaminase family protein [Streptomyces cirratus]|uniref:cytidine deaminase family protein n=1 Tax=Streptomyces cirratus TaxID=68187 RepID=UPI00361B5444
MELARRTIDAHTDAGPDEDGIHTMGAAVMAADYRMFAGVNLYHFTGGPCAELVALGAARAQGARQMRCIVAVGNHGRGVVGPCGRDRQVFVDYYPTMRVIVPTPAGPRSVLAADLLPLTQRWTPEGMTGLDPSLYQDPETAGPRSSGSTPAISKPSAPAPRPRPSASGTRPSSGRHGWCSRATPKSSCRQT